MSEVQWPHVVHERDGHRVVELRSNEVVVRSADDMLDVMGSLLWGSDAHSIIVHEHQLAPEFFQLRTGLAGEIVQKCSNYRFRLAVVGHFQKYSSESLQAFIRESNRGRHVYFATTVDEALSALGVEE